MLKTPILHPQLLAALASAGHLGKVLISDGNYPHNTKPNPRATYIYANFAPGVVGAAKMLEIVAQTIPIEAVELMAPETSGAYAMKTEPPIWADFRRILKEHADFTGEMIKLQKPEFHAQARSEDTAVVIATAETQIFANILITIGVVR